MTNKEIKVLGKQADDLLFGEEPEELEESSWFPKEDGSDVPTSDSENENAVEIPLPFNDNLRVMMGDMFERADEVRQAKNERYAIAVQEGQAQVELIRMINHLTNEGNATAERLKASTNKLCELVTNTEVTDEVSKIKKTIDQDIDTMLYLIYGLADK